MTRGVSLEKPAHPITTLLRKVTKAGDPGPGRRNAARHVASPSATADEGNAQSFIRPQNRWTQGTGEGHAGGERGPAFKKSASSEWSHIASQHASRRGRLQPNGFPRRREAPASQECTHAQSAQDHSPLPQPRRFRNQTHRKPVHSPGDRWDASAMRAWNRLTRSCATGEVVTVIPVEGDPQK